MDDTKQPLAVRRPAAVVPSGEGDPLAVYLHQVREAPFLSAEEELDLARRWYDDDDKMAGQRLVTAHLRLVVKMAFEYHRQWANVLDIIQEGNLGLLEALERFDPYRHNRFSTYARYWIRAMILRFLLDNYRMVKFSSTRAGRKLFFQLQKERERLIRLGIDPSTPRLAKALEVSESDIIEVAAHLDRPALDLDSPTGGEMTRPLHETIPQDQLLDPEEGVAEKDLEFRVRRVMDAFAKTLDGRELEIWELRTVADDPLSYSQLGARFGISKQRVNEIERRLKERLRKRMVAEGFSLE